MHHFDDSWLSMIIYSIVSSNCYQSNKENNYYINNDHLTQDL